LVHILNEISPCNCLETEVVTSRLEEEQDTGQKRLRSCSNFCEKKEESYDEFRCCAGCKISFYCSGHCYRQRWRENLTPQSFPHALECAAFQELVSYLRGNLK
jgi:radical SAM protein with 4Fe4S-binding SPASM domain